MSIVTISTKAVSGALNPVKSQEEIRVGKGVKALVIMEGYIGADRIKNPDNGEYISSAYGRLPVQVALTGEGEKQRYVLDVAGGLRGVLFKNTKKGQPDASDADYTGNLSAGDGNEFPLFGRKIQTENGTFIAISSMERKPIKNRSTESTQGNDFQDDEIPF